MAKARAEAKTDAQAKRILKAQAKASIQAHSGNILPDAPSVFESMGAQGAHGYGATGGSYGATAYMGGDL